MAADDGHVFAHAGPTHLPAIDWSYEPHRRSVAATLVRACYILEYDRQNNRQGPEALAPPWWMFFHFQLIQQLMDEDESTIFGAIFEYKPTSTDCKHYMANNTPKYIITFRGTILRDFRDIILDLETIRNRLQGCKRTEIAMKTVHDFVEARGRANVWIAGHSLGSSIGMYVGKHMAHDHDILLEAYLFNPPFISPSLEWIKSTRVKHVIYVARSLTRAGLARVAKGLHKHSHKTDDSFDELSAWVPSLFVHATDPICSGYISYFEEREKLGKTGLGRHLRKISMKVSRATLLFNVGGKDLKEPEPLHLLPSASVTRNLSHSDSFLRSHELDQWWRADMPLQSTLYKLDTESM